MPNEFPHPDWCVRARCDARHLFGAHRGMIVSVGDDRKHPLATAWWQQADDGERMVGFAASGVFDPEDAARIVAALEQVAGPVARDRVS